MNSSKIANKSDGVQATVVAGQNRSKIGQKPIDVVFERPPKDNPCLGAKKVLSCRTKKAEQPTGVVSGIWQVRE